MTPANQRFGTDQRTGGQFHLRLKIHNQLVESDRTPQHHLKLQPFDRIGSQFLGVAVITVSSFVLRLIHCSIRILN